MRSSLGFTLIELLIVMVIIAILAGIIIAVPLDKINEAGDTIAQNDITFYGQVSESYSTAHQGYYPASFSDLYASNEISKMPSPPSGYSYTFSSLPNGCTAGVSCTGVVITSSLKWIRNISTPFIRYESATGKTCKVADPNTSCP